MGKFMLLFYQTLKPTTRNNYKKFSLRMPMINTNKCATKLLA